MGAIAVSKKEEQQIERLRKQLGIPTKSGLLRAALKILEEKTEEKQLCREVQESVRRCAAADKEENRELFPEERFEAAIRKVRKKTYGRRQKKNPGRR